MSQSMNLDTPLPSGPWTLYFHAPKEKRWTMDTFQTIASFKTLREALSVLKELGDKLKRGMYFCMRDPIPPLWENFQNIRGGSYSLRGSADTGSDAFKVYMLAAMLDGAVQNKQDTITGVSISPKIMNGPNGAQKVGFYIIKIWNKDCAQFNKPDNLSLLHEGLVATDVLYTPHVEKKM
jgi:hypothetical protein